MPRWGSWFALIGSATFHGLVVLGGHWLPPPAAPPTPPRVAVPPIDVTVVRLPRVSGLAGRRDALAPRADAAVETVVEGRGARDRTSRPDQRREGRSGDATAVQAALNLADADDGLTLTRATPSHVSRDQLNRLKTAKDRASREDRRATRRPMDWAFVVSGTPGQRRARRTPAAADPSRGSHAGGTVLVPGPAAGVLLAVAAVDGRVAFRPGPRRAGDEARRRGAGVADTAPGKRQRRRARVTLARPVVTRGRPSVASPERGRPRDTVDSSVAVARAVRSLVHASSAGGPRGAGRGGEPGPGRSAGSGGVRGPGSRSYAAGSGSGDALTADPRFTGYYARLLRRIDWSDAFPQDAALEGRGGVARLSLTIHRSGRLLLVRLLRPSGVPAFDANLVAAARRAAPFETMPSVLTTALRGAPLVVHVSFDALNPPVGLPAP